MSTFLRTRPTSPQPEPESWALTSLIITEACGLRASGVCAARKGLPMSRRGNWKRLAFGLAAAPLTLLPALTCLPDKRPRDSASALEGHHFPVQALAFGPNGDTLTSAAYQMGGPAVEVEVTDWD